jgi:hypothetical protein
LLGGPEKAGGGGSIPSLATTIETFPFFIAGKTEAALARAEKSFQSYRKLSVPSTCTTPLVTTYLIASHLSRRHRAD